MDDLSGTAIRGYELRECIGVGGLGAVYRAYQPLVDREVAIKVILPQYANDPEFIRRFEVEAQVIARLEHLHIVPLFDYWREPDRAYLVMRYLRGGGLRASMDRERWSLESIVRLLDQVAAALTVAHRNHVIHRDIKPDNILLDEDNNAYLADFGIAKDIRQDDPDDSKKVSGAPAYLSPEQVRSEQVTPQSDIYSLGIVLYELVVGERPFDGATTGELMLKHLKEPLPHLDKHCPDLPLALDDVIQKAAAKVPSERYPDAISLATAFRQAVTEWTKSPDFEITAPQTPPIVAGEEPRAILEALSEPVNPYKGLRPFREADATDFFGRTALVNQLLARLKEEGPSARFLAVIGPSGSGKSSVVRAGVVPAIRHGALPGSSRWFIVEMLPGTHPLEELEAALLRVAVNPPASLLEQLQNDERGLLRAVNRVLPADEEVELLLILDQFEEVFTLVEDEAARAHFLNSLHTAVSNPRSRLRVILTLRADFYDRPLNYPGFGNLICQRFEVVLPLLPEELEQAVTGPAHNAGLTLEPGLVAAIINDVGQHPGALPMLQYALTELFEHREGHRLSLAAYRDSGGVLGALTRRAEGIYQELDADGQDAARQLFLRLITPDEAPEDVRRRVQLTEIMAGDGKHLSNVVDMFSKYRLLTFDRDPVTRAPTTEIAHEALIRQWSRLRGWLDESREDMRLHRLLTMETGEWLNSSRDSGYLASGIRLHQFEHLAESARLRLNPDEMDYLKASIAEREAQEEQEKSREAHERDLERRAARNLRYLAVGLVVFLVVAVSLLLITLDRANEAQVQADNARAQAGIAERNATEIQSLALASSAQRALDDNDIDLAISLALEANRIENPPDRAQLLLSEAAYAPGTRRLFSAPDTIWDVAFSPDGRTALLACADGSAILWNVETGVEIRRFEGHTDAVTGVAFSPDGLTALTASSDSTLILWDTATGEILRRLEGHTAGVSGVVFLPDGRRALSSSDDMTLILWDVTTGELLRRLEDHQTPVWALAVSQDSQLAMSGSSDGRLVVWNIETGEIVHRLDGHSDSGTEEYCCYVTDVAFSSNGRLALSSSGDGTVRLWDVLGEDEIRRLEGNAGGVNNVAFFDHDSRALSVSDDGTLILWEVETGTVIRRLLGHRAGIEALALSPDGHSALTGSTDHTARLWDLQQGALVRRLGQPWLYQGHIYVVWDTAFSPDGRTALTGSYDGAILWDVDRGIQLRRFEGTGAVAFSPDGHFAITISSDLRLILLDMTTGEAVRTFDKVHTEGVTTVIFRPDGQSVISSSSDGSVILWDVETGTVLRRFDGHNAPIWGLGMSRDGRLAMSGDTLGHLILWDIETGEALLNLEGHADSGDWEYCCFVTDIAFSPDGRTALSGAGDMTMRLWDLETGQEISRFEGHEAGVNNVAFSADGSRAFSASDDTTLILWDVETGEVIRRFRHHTGGIEGMDVSPDGHLLISSSWDQTARLWDVETGQEIRRLERRRADQPVYCAAISPDGHTVLSGSRDTIVRLWDIETGEEIRHFEGHTEPIWSVAFSPDGRRAVSGSGNISPQVPSTDNSVRLWDVETGVEIRRFEEHPAAVLTVDFSPDGHTVLSGDESGLLILWDAETGAEIRRFEGQGGAIWSAAFSPDGRGIISGDESGLVILWDAETGAEIRRFEGHSDAVHSVVFSQDGQRVLSGSADQTAIVWNVQTGGEVLRLPNQVAEVWTGAFSPDGQVILTGLENGDLILWNTATGQEIRHIEEHDSPVRAVAFSPDGHNALSFGEDGGMNLWRVDSLNDLIAWTTANRYVSELTCDEWDYYLVTPICAEGETYPTRGSS